MSRDHEFHSPHVASILQQLERSRGKQFSTRIGQILEVNIGRQRFAELRESALAEYVARVVEGYDRWHKYVECLQSQSSCPEWAELIEKLRAWAYVLITKMGVNGSALIPSTIDIADDAGCEIINAHFPYDIEFDKWAYRLMRNVAYNHLRKSKRRAKPQELEMLSLRQVEGLELVEASSGVDAVEREVERSHDVRKAMDGLSDKLYNVIWLYYFHGKSTADIAELLCINRTAVYKRHFDALEKMRRYFS